MVVLEVIFLLSKILTRPVSGQNFPLLRICYITMLISIPEKRFKELKPYKTMMFLIIFY